INLNTPTLSTLTRNKGYLNVETGAIGNGSNGYINAYDYTMPNMPTSLAFVTASSSEDTQYQYKYFYENPTASQKTYAYYGGTLKWSFSKFRPSYEGGVIYVTALLTGNDGNTQEFDIPFLVDRRYVYYMYTPSSSPASLTGYADTNGYLYTTSGLTTEREFEINPNNGKTLTLPTSYYVQFKLTEPTYNTSSTAANIEGRLTWTAKANTSAELYRYTIVSMPANTSWTFPNSGDGATSDIDGKYASIQINSQQRLTVKLKVATNARLTTTPTASNLGVSSTTNNYRLNTTYTYNSTTYKVVWYGVAKVYTLSGAIEAAFPVMFTSSGTTVDLPRYAHRKVEYVLYACIGAIVDINGNVVTTTTATANTGTSFTYNGTKYPVMTGQTIPVGQRVTTTSVTITN
ncbi:MAG: hypothetical protein K2M36_00870, partial [Clostridia bacterium]|nr:hypothetical protein [Clostridia bacterium]